MQCTYERMYLKSHCAMIRKVLSIIVLYLIQSYRSLMLPKRLFVYTLKKSTLYTHLP